MGKQCFHIDNISIEAIAEWILGKCENSVVDFHFIYPTVLLSKYMLRFFALG